MNNLTTLTHLNTADYALFFEKGIGYEAYMESMVHDVENHVERMYAEYIPMNLQRSKRIAKTFRLSPEIAEMLANLSKKVNWLVISEHWCGDASQIMPIFHGIAAASNGMIDLRIVYRDENPDLIDAHLTNGGKSIPKLIQLTTDFQITGTWGPRPVEAQKLVTELKANPIEGVNYADVLHKWYADDKTHSSQAELLKLLKQH